MTRALVVFPGALGDLILLAPALAALRTAGVRLELSVRRALADLARAMFPGPHGPAVDGAAMTSLFTAELDPAVAAWLRGAARVDAWLGADDVVRRHARALGVDDVRSHHVESGDADLHATSAYARALGVEPAPMPRIADDWLAGAAAPARPRTLLIHPGAGSAAKRWKAEGFRRLADTWQRRGGDAVVLLGPAEEDQLASWRASGHEIATGLDLRAAAALIASAPWYVGNDSGMSHLAGLLERRGAVLFGPTRAARWRPLGGRLEPIRWSGVAEKDVVLRIDATLTPADLLDTLTPRT
jgi:heptosyltransferase-3